MGLDIKNKIEINCEEIEFDYSEIKRRGKKRIIFIIILLIIVISAKTLINNLPIGYKLVFSILFFPWVLWSLFYWTYELKLKKYKSVKYIRFTDRNIITTDLSNNIISELGYDKITNIGIYDFYGIELLEVLDKNSKKSIIFPFGTIFTKSFLEIAESQKIEISHYLDSAGAAA